ncbi:DUF3122 domain-containing protein [Cronbergia sp. UHCC 0137]|uniref:DUF3122 domain-containing protein n=1 Tax=Cronbergia sp. UHCC 0137 TaxID=3110239 RepID=UPI002B1F0DD1|nr:DUF3122 domain-containing protein [Cronbergia sp. UHCC 0137]MEA5619781.1 DUF3122 domain-containing protein [Cronbergia sp. UHCC 0137]
MKKIFWWLLLLGTLTIFIFLSLGTLSDEMVIAAVNRLEPTPGEVIYRSQVKLDDQSGKVWQVVLFKQTSPTHKSTINLRLVGFPGTAELIHPQPLKITSTTGKVWTATDVFLDEAPAPTIGQYDFTEILSQLPQAPLTLAIPLPLAKSINIYVPVSVVKEWRTLINS